MTWVEVKFRVGFWVKWAIPAFCTDQVLEEKRTWGGGPILITNDAEVIFFFKVNLLLHGWQEIRRRMFCFLCVKLIKAEVVFPNREQRVCEW